MKVALLDPQGLQHVIEFDSQGWHGYDNIVHGWEPSQRQAVIEAVLTAVASNWGSVKVSLPYGFSYLT